MEIALLGSDHDRAAFDCGKEPLNDYLQKQAAEHARKRIATTWVGTSSDDARRILGYCTLALASVQLAKAERDALGDRLPPHPLPVLSLVYLATDLKAQRRGVATEFIGFAARKALQFSVEAGCYALELRPIDDEAHDFYVRRGFLELAQNPHRMYIPVKTLAQAFAALSD